MKRILVAISGLAFMLWMIRGAKWIRDFDERGNMWK